MRSIAVNNLNDIFIGPDGNLAMVVDQEAFQQNSEAVMKVQRGELNLDLANGVPTLATVWNAWKPAQFIAAGRAMLAQVPGWIATKSFNLARAGGVATYTAVIENEFTDAAITVTGDLTP